MKKTKVKKELTARAARYGQLVRAWNWRTTPERLERAEAFRLSAGMTRTELIERAIDLYLHESQTR